MSEIRTRLKSAGKRLNEATEKATTSQQTFLNGAQALLMEYARPTARTLEAFASAVETAATVIEEYADNVRDLTAALAAATQATKAMRDVRKAYTFEQLKELDG